MRHISNTLVIVSVPFFFSELPMEGLSFQRIYIGRCSQRSPEAWSVFWVELEHRLILG